MQSTPHSNHGSGRHLHGRPLRSPTRLDMPPCSTGIKSLPERRSKHPTLMRWAQLEGFVASQAFHILNVENLSIWAMPEYTCSRRGLQKLPRRARGLGIVGHARRGIACASWAHVWAYSLQNSMSRRSRQTTVSAEHASSTRQLQSAGALPGPVLPWSYHVLVYQKNNTRVALRQSHVYRMPPTRIWILASGTSPRRLSCTSGARQGPQPARASGLSIIYRMNNMRRKGGGIACLPREEAEPRPPRRTLRCATGS